MDPSIQPFKIHIPDATLESLKAKLTLAEFPDETPLSNSWNYGVPVSDMKRLVEYWKDGFDWRAQEEKLNKLPHFTTQISVDGFGELAIHFVHKKSGRPNSVPLIFSHGWPGSFLEVEKILPLLTDPKDGNLAFDVVAPSLPNFGFSEAPSKPGFGSRQYAECAHKLMLKLGYTKYVAQGGDWGFTVTRYLAILYPQHCLAYHLNMVWANAPTLRKHPLLYLKSLLPKTAREKQGLERTKWFYDEGWAYNLLQSTKPATIGLALRDSPVALLAWIYEKLRDWTDEYPWTDDEILTWVSVYLFSTAGPDASSRIYYETTHPKQGQQPLDYVAGVKMGLSTFPRDILVYPACYGATLGPVVYHAFHDKGGHFAAHEQPDLLVGDLNSMFGPGGGAHDEAKRCMVGT